MEKRSAPNAERNSNRSTPAGTGHFLAMAREAMVREAPAPMEKKKALGVTVEAAYTVGEYDIVLLSATQSDGLETWLRVNGYKIPPGAGAALQSYIKQNMKFFVARVNLKEKAKAGISYLRPLQFAFEINRLAPAGNVARDLLAHAVDAHQFRTARVEKPKLTAVDHTQIAHARNLREQLERLTAAT